MRRQLSGSVRRAVALLIALAFATLAAAAPLTLHYAGRLIEANGAPRQGAVRLEASFYTSREGGAPIGAAQSFDEVALQDGMFELTLSFAPGDFHALFADNIEVWVEIKDAGSGVALPRQRLNPVPYARKIPVDGDTLAFDADGKLAVAQIPATSVTGLTSSLSAKADATTVAALQTQVNAKADAAATTAALAGKADGVATTAALAGKAATAHSHTLAGDVTGDLASATVTKLQGRAVDSTAPTTVGQVLKWDGSKWYPGPDDGGVSGAVSNGANLGGGAGNVFKAVNAGSMELRTLAAGSNIAVSTVGDTVQLATTAGLTTSAQDGLVLGPHGVAAGNTGELRFKELAAGGANFVALKSPDALAGDVTYTLPDVAPASDGQILSGTTAGVMSWTTLPSALPPSGAAGGDLTGSYPNPDIAANAVTAAEIAANAVDTAELNDNAVTAAKLADGAVSTAKLAAGAVDNGKLAADAVTSAKIQDGQVQTADLAAGAVTGAELAADAVTSAKIANGAIVDADINASAAIARGKLAAGTASHVLVNDGSGNLSSEAQLATARGGTGVNSTATYPTSGVVVTRDASETLTNKTLGTTNTLTGATAASFTNGAATVTLPTATGTLATLAGTETLTNKTLTSPTINGGTMTSALGTVGAPSYSFSGDTDSGIWSSGADTVNLSTGGAERLRVTSGGNVGIGTTAPSNKLTVGSGIAQSNALIAVRNAPNSLEWGHNNQAGYGNTLGYDSSSGGGWICFDCEAGTTANTYMTRGRIGSSIYGSNGITYFRTIDNSNADNQTPTTNMAILANGNVGIGTTTPALSMDVVGAYGWPASSGTAQTGIMRLGYNGQGVLDFGVKDSSGGSWIQSTNKTSLALNYPLILNPNGGNVGIGSSSPIGKLNVVSDPASAAPNLMIGRATAVSGAESASFTLAGTGILHSGLSWVPNSTTANSRLSITMGGDADAGLNPAVLSILGNGNVGIGTATPQAALDVNGGIKMASSSTCAAANEGTQRYNSTVKRMEFCDGTSWRPVSGGNLQALETTLGTLQTLTGSWVSYLSQAITPNYTGSKIRVTAQLPYTLGASSAENCYLWGQLKRGSTVIQSKKYYVWDSYSDWKGADMVFDKIDSPSTTSSTTYSIELSVTGCSGGGYLNNSTYTGSTSYMQIVEIAP